MILARIDSNRIWIGRSRASFRLHRDRYARTLVRIERRLSSCGLRGRGRLPPSNVEARGS
jgi:hypothetical protein